ncbi:hypothetical protein SDRG_13938, partial [Saprolegnia diclina VS20]
MQDPNRRTTDAMQALQSMMFVHLIDAPLLALVMPMLLRGLTDRISETKKAALIFDNTCSMVNDAKDLALYLDTICRQTLLLARFLSAARVRSKPVVCSPRARATSRTSCHGSDELDLESLSNESDGYRDVAMHAGSIVFNSYALSNRKDILPALEAGIFDDNWRIRESSISLLGDLVYCVMPEVGPILRASLDLMNPAGMRLGYCLGLAEVIQCSPKKQLEDFVERFVVALEDALCNALSEVRRAASDTFDVFHKGMGYRSIDELIPRLLKRITSVYDLVQECLRSNRATCVPTSHHACSQRQRP